MGGVNTRLLAIIAVSAMALAVTACGSGTGGDKPTPVGGADDRGFRNFRERIKDAEDEGFDVYWLGREFTAGGLTFRGPSVPDEGDEVAGGGVEFSYDTQLPTGGGTGISVYAFSPAAWALREQQQGTLDPHVTTRVMVHGHEATMVATTTATRPVNQRRLIVHFGETTVQVIAASGGAAVEGGPDVNPLIDEATFLAVIEQLRPYPE
jgi:hypothetical protein